MDPGKTREFAECRTDLRLSGFCGYIAKLPVEVKHRGGKQTGGFPKRSKGADCKSAASCFSGSNPLSATPR